MDMKKKMNEAYNSDKNGLKERVVLGLTASVDSLSAAYLLKIQKYELIAVTIVTGWEMQGIEQDKTFSCSFSDEKIEFLKSFCQQLNIPHYVERINEEFKDTVIDPWLSEKIVGIKSKTCWNCHELRMRTLHQKMIDFDAHFLATGHYAKIFKNDQHETAYVHTSNDQEYDQSIKLSRLPNEILKDLLLPLSDLNRKEVLKLAENFGIEQKESSLMIDSCLSLTPALEEIIKKIIPARFLKEGEVVSLDNSAIYGQHDGMFRFVLGEVFQYSQVQNTPKYLASYLLVDKKIRLVDESYFLRSKHLLVNCHISKEVHLVEPMKGYIQLDGNSWVECWVSQKTLNSISLDFENEVKLTPTERIAVFKKIGRNSKILLTGDVQILTLPATKEGEANASKINPLLDF